MILCREQYPQTFHSTSAKKTVALHMQGNKLVWSIPVLDRQYVKSLLVTIWLQPSTIYLAECCVEICNNVTVQYISCDDQVITQLLDGR